MSTVTVPAEVAKALDHYKEAWSQFPENERAFLFMSMGSEKASNHEAEVLKSFAQKESKTFIKAFMFGYEAEKSLEDEILQIINDWFDAPRLATVEEERIDLSERITKFIQSRS